MSLVRWRHYYGLGWLSSPSRHLPMPVARWQDGGSPRGNSRDLPACLTPVGGLRDCFPVQVLGFSDVATLPSNNALTASCSSIWHFCLRLPSDLTSRWARRTVWKQQLPLAGCEGTFTSKSSVYHSYQTAPVAKRAAPCQRTNKKPWANVGLRWRVDGTQTRDPQRIEPVF